VQKALKYYKLNVNKAPSLYSENISYVMYIYNCSILFHYARLAVGSELL